MSSANLMDVETENRMETTESNVNEQAKWFDLAPDRKLLDSNFEGYKLSLEPFAQYKLDLNDQQQLDTHSFIESDSQKYLLYQHLKLFGLQNLLIVNHFDDSNLYYFDQNLRLRKIVYKKPKILPTRAIVSTTLKLESESLDRANISMKFVDLNTSVLFDGKSTIYLCQIETSKKSEDPLIEEKWHVQLKYVTSLDKAVLRDAVLFEDKLHLLLMSVVESKESSNNKLETIITWITFQKENEQELKCSSFKLTRTRKLNCANSVPEYLALETNGQSIYVSGPSFIKFTYDSEKPVLTQIKRNNSSVAEKMSTDEVNTEKIEKFYNWNQNNDEINLNVLLNYESVCKNDLKVELNFDSLCIKYKDEVVLKGSLFSTVKIDESVWTLNTNNKKIEFVLSKAKPGEVWTSFLKDNDLYGEYKIERASEGFLEQFTSEAASKGNETKTLFTLEQQLEECDGLVDDQTMGGVDNDEKFLMLRRLNGDSHLETHKTYINENKFLFEVRVSAHKSAALCLRHDVDGILWQPHRVSHPGTVWLTHEHTFLAFGYVQASKQETKFRSCSPDFSYVCVADSNKHVYVYKQDSQVVDTQLKNRKTGKVHSHVAKQHLISLENDKEIYGLYCSNEFLILLMKENCYFFRVNQNLNEKFD